MWRNNKSNKPHFSFSTQTHSSHSQITLTNNKWNEYNDMDTNAHPNIKLLPSWLQDSRLSRYLFHQLCLATSWIQLQLKQLLPQTLLDPEAWRQQDCCCLHWLWLLEPWLESWHPSLELKLMKSSLGMISLSLVFPWLPWLGISSLNFDLHPLWCDVKTKSEISKWSGYQAIKLRNKFWKSQILTEEYLGPKAYSRQFFICLKVESLLLLKIMYTCDWRSSFVTKCKQWIAQFFSHDSADQSVHVQAQYILKEIMNREYMNIWI